MQNDLAVVAFSTIFSLGVLRHITVLIKVPRSYGYLEVDRVLRKH